MSAFALASEHHPDFVVFGINAEEVSVTKTLKRCAGRASRRVARTVGLTVCAAVILAPALSGLVPEYLVVLGAGHVGIWDAEFTVTSTSDQPETVIVSRAPAQICPPLIECHTILTVPARGTRDTQAPFGSGVGAVYIGSADVPGVPTVLARAFVPSVPGVSVDLPVFRVSTLLSMNSEVLVFPGARKGDTGRCNLLLANVADPNNLNGGSVDLLYEVVSADGATIAGRTVSLDYGNTAFIADVPASLGVPVLGEGSVRVSKLGGQGTFWGIMAIGRPDGTFSISLGAAP